VIVGPANPHRQRLEARRSDPRVELVRPAGGIAALMAWADLAIAGAGTTAYELCCVGVPALIVAIADAQRMFGPALEREGLAVDLGWHEALEPARLAATIEALRDDPERRAELSSRGGQRVDGAGAARVLRALEAISGG
jgi:spore coat polysaccharide biosynthesis predicted glycosyltransferase SpsG